MLNETFLSSVQTLCLSSSTVGYSAPSLAKTISVNPSLFIVFSLSQNGFWPFMVSMKYGDLGWKSVEFHHHFSNFLCKPSFRKMCNTFWDILYFALTRTQTTKLALKNALHFTSHSLKLASSEKTSKSKVCGTQQEDAWYLVYLIINTTFIILWNKIGFSWKWESRKQGPKGL